MSFNIRSRKESILKHVLYIFTLTQMSVALVLPICDAFVLTHNSLNSYDHKYYLEVWLMLQYFVAIICLGYLQILIAVYEVRTKNIYLKVSKKRSAQVESEIDSEKSEEKIPYYDETDEAIGRSYTQYFGEKFRDEDEKMGIWDRSITWLDKIMLQRLCFVKHSSWKKLYGGISYLSWHPVGMNLYMRLGAVGFGFGVMIYDGFNLLSYLSSQFDEHCITHNISLTPKVSMHFVFVLWQTFFVFKYHRLVINVPSFVVALAFTHLAIVNFSQWLKVVIFEVQEDFALAGSFEFSKNKKLIDQCKNNEYTKITNPILYPVVVQYSLIVGTLFFKMLSRTNTSSTSNALRIHRNKFRSSGPLGEITDSKACIITDPVVDEFCEEENLNLPCSSKNTNNITSQLSQVENNKRMKYEFCPLHSHYKTMFGRKVYVPLTKIVISNNVKNSQRFLYKKNSYECAHSHSGLFAGLVVFLASCVAVVFFIKIISDMPDEKDENHEKQFQYALHIYQYSKISLLGVSFLVTIIAVWRTNQLTYRGIEYEDSFEYNLLSIGFNGNLIYYLFLLVPALEDFILHPNNTDRTDVAELYVIKCFLEIFQSILQFFFLVEAARRGPCCIQQATIKPGRSLMIFLLISNLTLWLMNTVEVPRADLKLTLHQKYYGVNGWNIISCCLIPLIIFFRFHSTVCLADIWIRCFRIDIIN